MKISWIQNGNEFSRVEGDINNIEQVPLGIYNVIFSEEKGWFLVRTGDQFLFDYKVYGLKEDTINYFLETYAHTTSNLGILFNGIKGTGKTVTAKVLANKLELPIIIVKSYGKLNMSLIEYLSSFNFDCIFFLDEFEKTWDEKDSTILQLMDGVYTSEYRKIFLLTTNSMTINENLLSRPSRIRYVESFGNLSKEVVSEYLDDNLKVAECKDCIIDFVDSLQISTIDILKTIIEDINIHGFEEFQKHKNIFNIKTAIYNYHTLYLYFDDAIELKKFGYNDTKFLQDVERTLNRPLPPNRFDYPDDESFAKAGKEYNKTGPSKRLSRINLTLPKAFTSYKVGEYIVDEYGDSEKVLKINHDKHILITECNDTIRYYYILNFNAKPSLYDEKSVVTNPYYQYL